MCGKGTSESWGKHIRRWLLCYTPTPAADGRNVLESISEIFAAECARRFYCCFAHSPCSLLQLILFVCACRPLCLLLLLREEAAASCRWMQPSVWRCCFCSL